MTTIVISPSVFQYGTSPVTMIVSGAGSNETIKFKVTSPNGNVTYLPVTVTESGELSKQIHLTNGEGTYVFELWYEGCANEESCIDLPPIEVLASKCAVSEGQVSDLILEASQANLVIGAEVIATVSGTPNSLVTLMHSSALGTNIYQEESNSSGIATFIIVLATTRDNLVAIQGNRNSNVILLKAAQSVNLPIPVTPVSNSLIRVSSVIPSSAMAPNEVFPYILRIQNLETVPIRVSIVSTSGDISQEIPIKLSLEQIPAGAVREFNYFLKGNHTNQDVTSMRLGIDLSYYKTTDVDKTPITSSFSDAFAILPRSLIASMILSEFVPDQARITIGQVVTMSIVVTNTGESDLIDVSMPDMQFTNAIGIAKFDGITITRNSSYRHQVMIKPTSAGSYLYSIDGTRITAQSQGNLITCVGSLTTMVTVNQV